MSANISFSYYPEGKKKALTMSYDDGQVHDRRLVDIFNKYGIKGTFHLNSGKLDAPNFLTSSEVGELFKGHEVSSHTVTHPYLSALPGQIMVEEILEDRKALETLAGYPVRGMSYPFGDYSEDVLKALPLTGIEYSRTVYSHGRFGLPQNFLTWNPTCHHNQNLLDKLKNFENPFPWEKMPLFYVWGHSFEFAGSNNWDMIEEFCKKAAFDENVWYATNVEIMDYIKAVRNLKFSVDRKIIYNPSAVAVWVGVDGQALKIESGQRVTL